MDPMLVMPIPGTSTENAGCAFFLDDWWNSNFDVFTMLWHHWNLESSWCVFPSARHEFEFSTDSLCYCTSIIQIHCYHKQVRNIHWIIIIQSVRNHEVRVVLTPNASFPFCQSAEENNEIELKATKGQYSLARGYCRELFVASTIFIERNVVSGVYSMLLLWRIYSSDIKLWFPILSEFVISV